jgi:uncharacterized protein YcbK (DUF882 family)
MGRPRYDPQKLRALARRCREKAKTAVVPTDTVQFRLWATELADKADEIERRLETTSGFRQHARRAPTRASRIRDHKGSFWHERY